MCTYYTWLITYLRFRRKKKKLRNFVNLREKTMRTLTCFGFILLLSACSAKSLPEDEESVVSIYTTVPTDVKTSQHIDVYSQIATNLAERITSPIYRFLGFGKNKTETKKWETIELLDEPQEATKNTEPISNDIEEREVEQLSVEALTKDVKKPEKITLYSNYLPVNGKLEQNQTGNDLDSAFDDEPFEFDDDVDDKTPRENGFFNFIEIVSSLFQLAWGAIVSFFTPNRS